MLDGVVDLEAAVNTNTNRNTTYDSPPRWFYGSSNGVGVVEQMHRCFLEWECGRDEHLGDIYISEGTLCR